MDTVWVSVTEERGSIAIMNVYQWRYFWQHSGEVDDRVVVFTMFALNTIDIVTDSTQGEPEHLERFVRPFEEGAEWTGPTFDGDTSRVTIFRSVTVPVGTFTRVARVDRIWNRDFEGGGNWSETWLDEEAGIVKRHFFSQYSDGATVTVTQNEVWQLIEYDLTTFSLQQFPQTIGTEWVYEVVHLFSEVGVDTVGFDTVTVTIVDARFLFEPPGGPNAYMLWENVWPSHTDTTWVEITGNTMTISTDTAQTIPPLPAWSYEFPMTVGKHWGIDYILVPVPIVSDKSALSTPAGDFPTVFEYSMSGGMLGSWAVQDWLAPGVGMVQRIYYPYTGMWPASWQEWRLLRFSHEFI
jgi:hypothetical protein